MKKIVLISGIIVLTICLFLIGEQIYLYYHYDKDNLLLGIENQTDMQGVNVKIIIDNSLAYDTYMVPHSGPLYGFRKSIGIGNYLIEVVVDGKSLYKEKLFVFLHRELLLEYEQSGRLVVYTSMRPMMIQ